MIWGWHFDLFLMFDTLFVVGGFVAETAGGSFTPHMVIVNAGEVMSCLKQLLKLQTCFSLIAILSAMNGNICFWSFSGCNQQDIIIFSKRPSSCLHTFCCWCCIKCCHSSTKCFWGSFDI